MVFTLTTSGSKVNGYSMEMTTADPALAGMEMSITASMKDNKMDMGMTMDMTITPALAAPPSPLTLPWTRHLPEHQQVPRHGASRRSSRW